MLLATKHLDDYCYDYELKNMCNVGVKGKMKAAVSINGDL